MAEGAILASDRTNFTTRKVTRNKGGQYVMIKRSICQDDITILNVYVPNKSIKTHEIKT